MTDPDRARVRKARRGDRQALTELYETHGSKLLGYLVGMLGERARAEDVFQEVWVKVIERLHHYREGQATFRAWLFRVAANAAVDRMRRDARRAGPELDAPTETGEPRIDRVPSDRPDPERTADSRLFAGRLNAMLDDLPERRRAAVLLRHQQGMSYEEIATALNVPIGTAKTLVHRGVTTLRDGLEEWDR